MKGYMITYKPFGPKERVSLHHILFGRLIYRNYRGKKYSYYVQGLLDKIPWIRIMDAKIFVLNIDDVNLEELRIFADIVVEECEREITIESLKTGEEHWFDISKEKGLECHVRRKKIKRS